MRLRGPALLGVGAVEEPEVETDEGDPGARRHRVDRPAGDPDRLAAHGEEGGADLVRWAFTYDRQHPSDRVEIAATDSSGKAVAAQTTSYVKVDAVSFKNGVVYLVAGGRTYTLSDASEIAA